MAAEIPDSTGPFSTVKRTVDTLCYYLVPFGLLWAYIAITAAIYYAVEKDCQVIYNCPITNILLQYSNAMNSGNNVQQNPTTAANTFATPTFPPMAALPTTSQTIQESVEQNTTAYQNWENLTYWSAFHFIAISVTTIGYGDVYPCTATGQILTVLFSLIGIPITLIGLTRMGKFFSFILHKLWLIFFRLINKPPYDDKDQRLIDNKYYVPLSVGLSITISWILLASLYFYFTLLPIYQSQRYFTYFSALYFTMISFLTIGYGDISPVKYDLIFVTFMFLLIGLSLATMCINLVQTQFELMFQEMVEMIEEEFQNQLDDSEKTMSDDKKVGVKDTMQKMKSAGCMNRFLMLFMGKHKKKKLERIYEKKSNLNSVETQTEVEVNDEEIQVDFSSDTTTISDDNGTLKENSSMVSISDVATKDDDFEQLLPNKPAVQQTKLTNPSPKKRKNNNGSPTKKISTDKQKWQRSYR